MSSRKKPVPVQHKSLTLPELTAKLPELRQQMNDLLAVAEQTGGEQLRDLTDCIMGFDDMVDAMSLQLENFEKRVSKLRRQLEVSK